MIELRKIRHIIGVAEYGSFAKAADALNITQSALTKSVQSVEGRLGLRLLNRTQRGVTPTAEGEWFIVQGARLIADAEMITADGKAVRELRRGRLRIGVAPAAFDWVCMASVPAFASRYPGIKLDVVSESVDAVRHMLLNGTVDLALGVIQNFATETELEATPVAEFPVDVYVRRGHPLDRNEPPLTAELLSYPMAGPTRAEPYWTLFKQLKEQHSTTFDIPHFLVDSFPMMRRLVERTDAFSMIVREQAHTDLFRAKFRSWPSDLVPPLSIWMAYRREWLPSPAASKFIEITQEQYQTA